MKLRVPLFLFCLLGVTPTFLAEEIVHKHISKPLAGAAEFGKHEVKFGQGDRGFQIAIGSSIDPEQKIGIEAFYFLLPKGAKENQSPSGPVYSEIGKIQETTHVLPGLVSRKNVIFQDRFDLRISRGFQGNELSGIFHFVKRDNLHLDVLGGFRWLQLQESVKFEIQTRALDPQNFISTFDRLKTSKDFIGGQFGMRTQYVSECWDFDGALKIGAGTMVERVNVEGFSLLSKGSALEIFDAWEPFFAQPRVPKSYFRRVLATSIEAGLRGGYRLSETFQIDLGYSFFWLTKMALADDQNVLSESNDFSFKNHGLWTQGLNAGVTLKF